MARKNRSRILMAGLIILTAVLAGSWLSYVQAKKMDKPAKDSYAAASQKTVKNNVKTAARTTVGSGSAVAEVPAVSQAQPGKISPIISANAHIVAVGSGHKINVKEGEPKLPANLKAPAPKSGERGYYIVHFNQPIYKEMRKSLEDLGAKIYDYLPNYAFIVSMDEDIRAKAKGISSMDWSGQYQPAYKFSEQNNKQYLEVNQKSNKVEVVISFFMEEDLGKNVSRLQSMGLNVKESSESEFNKVVRAEVDPAKIADIAQIPGVYFISPYVLNYAHNNKTILLHSTGSTLADSTIYKKGIHGEGEIVNITDTGCRPDHQNFNDPSVSITAAGDYPTHRKLIAYKVGVGADFGDNDNISPCHGTWTAGCVGGFSKYGTITVDSMAGMAKMAKLYIYDVAKGDTFYGIPGDYTLLLKEVYTGNAAGGARISSNSWGSAERYYENDSRAVDQFTWKYRDFSIFFSAGNEGGAVGADSIGAPARAKNTVCVGATAGRTTTGILAIANFSSRGPCKQGPYMKPDVMAIGGDGSTTYNPYSPNGTTTAGYQQMQGTSMACPAAAGFGALVRQYFREGWYPTGVKTAGNAFIPSGALIKAMQIASADTNLTGASVMPNGAGGWGRITMDSSLYFNGDARKLMVIDNSDGIVTGDQVSYSFNVPTGASDLRIVLVWYDYPAVENADLVLVNDLNLEVTTGATWYWGNRFATTSFNALANPTGTRDTGNVVEMVRLKAPAAGTYKAAIRGDNVPCGPQPFALVIVYNQSAFSASVRLDRTRYYAPATGAIGDTVRIAVVDSFGSTTAIDTARVAVWTKLETAPDTVKCIETAVSGNYFTGKIPLKICSPVHNDGILSTNQDDTVYARYIDTAPAFTDTAKARVDALLFTITNVRAEDPVPPNSTKKYIKWTTSEAATSTVYYGTTTALGSVATDSTQEISSGEVFDHYIVISSLAASTKYYFDVESKDHAGNTVRDNNGGLHYTFNTGATSGADVLVVVLNDDLQGAEFYHPEFLTQALDAGGWTYDWWSTKDNGIFSWNQLKNYKAVFFQVGQENYPPWTYAQKESIKVYRDKGGRFAVTGHDIGWASWYATYSSVADTLFCKNYLKFRWTGDITSVTWTSLRGMPSDPISGAYTAGVTYSPPRDGFAGDSIAFSKTGIAGDDSGYVWHGNVGGDSCSVRWQSAAALGIVGQGIWGGYKSRVVTNAFEITQIDTANKTSATRIDILNNLFIYLIGHDHPDVVVSAPVAGTTYATSPVTVSWTASCFGGAAVDTTFIEYSDNAGSSWNTITKGTAVTSPYSWNITALPNGSKYQIRVKVNDKLVYPSMMGSDTVGNFTIFRSGGDLSGPIVIPGSIRFNSNPITGGTKFRIDAAASDSLFGLSPIKTVRCSIPTIGFKDMKAVDGTFNSIYESVFDSIATIVGAVDNSYTIYLRAQDNSPAKSVANWGPLSSYTIVVAKGQPSLSVSLTSLTATAATEGISVNWRTESEDNAYQWVIKRADENSGEDYQEIAWLKAEGGTSAHDYSYQDQQVTPGVSYKYLLIQVDNDGSKITYGPISSVAPGLPKVYALSVPTPNPFSTQVQIRYQLPEKAKVSLKVYNLNGQLVRTLVNETQRPNYYQVNWDGRNEQGNRMSSGVYFYKLNCGDFTSTKKVTLLK